MSALERVLVGFVDAVMTGDLDVARLRFADAQALGLEEVRTPAALWAELERRAARALPDEPRAEKAERLLVAARGLSS